MSEVQGPAGRLYDLFGSVCWATALRCLLDMGVFEAMPGDGTPVTVEELLARVNAGKGGGGVVEMGLLVRLLRNVTGPGVGGLVVEVGEEVYAWRGDELGILEVGGLGSMFRQGGVFSFFLPSFPVHV